MSYSIECAHGARTGCYSSFTEAAGVVSAHIADMAVRNADRLSADTLALLNAIAVEAAVTGSAEIPGLLSLKVVPQPDLQQWQRIITTAR